MISQEEHFSKNALLGELFTLFYSLDSTKVLACFCKLNLGRHRTIAVSKPPGVQSFTESCEGADIVIRVSDARWDSKQVAMAPTAFRRRVALTARRTAATWYGILQAVTASVWLLGLAAAFTITIAGLTNVDDCMRHATPPPPSPPPRPPPPPPSPPPAKRLDCARLCHVQPRTPHCSCSASAGRMPTTLGDLLKGLGGGPVQRIGRRQLARARRRHSYDSYSYDSYDDDDDDDDADDATMPSPYDDYPAHAPPARAPPPDFLQSLTSQVITPLLAVVGTFGGIGAIASLLAGMLAIGGAASHGPLLLRAAAILSVVAALGGCLLAVGSGVIGGLLSSGGAFLHAVMAREFPHRAEACDQAIKQYAQYVGYAMLGLAASCALGSLSAIASCDASCKAAATLDHLDIDPSERQSLVVMRSGTASAAHGPSAAQRRQAVAQPHPSWGRRAAPTHGADSLRGAVDAGMAGGGDGGDGGGGGGISLAVLGTPPSLEGGQATEAPDPAFPPVNVTGTGSADGAAPPGRQPGDDGDGYGIGGAVVRGTLLQPPSAV